MNPDRRSADENQYSEQRGLTDRIAHWVDSLTPAQAIWRAIAVMVSLAAIHFLAVSYLTGHYPWKVISPGSVPLAHLGAYGDSVAPWTAGFALLAALFAGLTFREQRDALNIERANAKDARDQTNVARFDALLVQALDMYDRAFATLDRAAKRRKNSKSGQSLLRSLRKHRLLGNIPTGDAAFARKYWKRLLRQATYHPVERFATTVFALIQWLDDVVGATGLHDQPGTDRWIRLFASRMSGVERHMLMELIVFTAPTAVKKAERRLKMFDWAKLHRYTELHASAAGDSRFRNVPRARVTIAPELYDLVDRIEEVPDSDLLPMIVRNDGDHFLLVSGLCAFVKSSGNVVIPVLMSHNATDSDYSEMETQELVRHGSTRPFDANLVNWATVRLALHGSVQSVWLMSSDPEKKWFSRDDTLSFLVVAPAGTDLRRTRPDADYRPMRVRIREEGEDEIWERGVPPQPFSSLIWRQLSDDYAEFSEPQPDGASRRGRAWRLLPSPFDDRAASAQTDAHSSSEHPAEPPGKLQFCCQSKVNRSPRHRQTAATRGIA